MNAKDMTPGKVYQGTADGPEKLDGVTFTVLATVTFNPQYGGVPDDDLDPGTLVQVLLDAWGFPFPEVVVFAPYDWVLPMNDDGILPNKTFTFGWTKTA